jgi:glycosyltransferase involved in cell wall biosynthesis
MTGLRNFFWSLCERVFARVTKKDPLWLTILLDGFKAKLWLGSWMLRTTFTHRTRPGNDQPLRIAFMMTWFGKEAAGGAESEAYGLIQALKRYAPEIEIEVYATTLKEFSADWNQPHHNEGSHNEEGVLVHRFDPEPVERTLFHYLNGTHLMQGGTVSLWSPSGKRISPLQPLAEAYYLRHMVYSPRMLESMHQHLNNYHAIVLIPYMFTTAVLGAWIARHKALLIPCLHNERYAYMDLYEKAFSKTGGALCHVRSEAALYRRLYPCARSPILLGEQVDTDIPLGDAARFRAKYNIHTPFILYAGRQISGKNLPLLIEWFNACRESTSGAPPLQLVLIGKGDMDYQNVPGVIQLGFIPAEDKADAYRAALCLAMLSIYESFSIVLMEAWLQSIPVIVHADCDVTNDHVKDANGGFAVRDQASFQHAVVALQEDKTLCQTLGDNGRAYVQEHYRPEVIVSRFKSALMHLKR